MTVDPNLHIWLTLAALALALALFMWERLALEVACLTILAALLLLFHFVPLTDAEGRNLLGPEALLMGFANPALITVLALLVIGQALIRTGALDGVAQLLFDATGGRPRLAVTVSILAVTLFSGFLNNTPVVIMFIPVLQSLARKTGDAPSRILMPLSFAAILGGMTTLLGSSTNLLVSGTLSGFGEEPFSFFDFTLPGVILAGVGLLYVLFVAPLLLPMRASLAGELTHGGQQYIAHITVTEVSSLVGQRSVGGLFPDLGKMTLRLIQRGEHAFLPPFDESPIRAGDVLVVAATRDVLMDALKSDQGLVLRPIGVEGGEGGEIDLGGEGQQLTMAEVMVPPASRMIGFNLEQVGFRYQTGCLAIGLQRRSRMIRTAMTEIRLEAGDVILVVGRPDDIRDLRRNRDLVLIESSATDLGSPMLARRSALIFGAVVAAAASGLVPIVVAAIAGAAGMVAIGALNVRQASRAIDRRIFMLIGTALALGVAMDRSGAAGFLAHNLVAVLAPAGPLVLLSAFFLLVALATNVLSNNVCAVLFTPIAVGIAHNLGLPAEVFAVAVIFAANCSFATPIGYQTNLLVMGPGNYHFRDFTRAGLPLLLVIWVVFTALIAPVFYGIGF
jgi:di/tricarboxylate transporter